MQDHRLRLAQTGLILAGLLICASAFAGGDRIQLKDQGRYVYGDILFFHEGVITISTPQGVERIPITDIEKIDFGPGTQIPAEAEE